MKKLNNYINEKLKITKDTKINSEISTFQELMEKYGNQNKNPKKLDKYKDLIVVDNNYRKQLANIFTMWGEWDEFYQKFKDNSHFYIKSEDFDVIIEHQHHGDTKLICRKLKEYTNEPQELGYLNIVYNTDGCTQFELHYELSKNYMKDTEEILTRAFEYIINTKL